MVDKRVGRALVAAVYATDRHISIMEVALKASRQGLSPVDVDTPNGVDALIAIAVALMATPILYRPVIDRPRGLWASAVDWALKIVSSKFETPAQVAAAHWRAEVDRKREINRRIEMLRRAATVCGTGFAQKATVDAQAHPEVAPLHEVQDQLGNASG